MTTVPGEVTPYALAIALSPLGVIVAILLLFTPRPRPAAGAFLIGWAVGSPSRPGLRRARVRSSNSATSPPSAACRRRGLPIPPPRGDDRRDCPGSAAARQAECARRWVAGD